jgi:hypothetical protein
VASASTSRLALFDTMASAMRPLILKPSVASWMPEENRSFHASEPWSLWASASMRMAPGVPTERPEARTPLKAVPSLVAVAGAGNG